MHVYSIQNWFGSERSPVQAAAQQGYSRERVPRCSHSAPVLLKRHAPLTTLKRQDTDHGRARRHDTTRAHTKRSHASMPCRMCACNLARPATRRSSLLSLSLSLSPALSLSLSLALSLSRLLILLSPTHWPHTRPRLPRARPPHVDAVTARTRRADLAAHQRHAGGPATNS